MAKINNILDELDRAIQREKEKEAAYSPKQTVSKGDVMQELDAAIKREKERAGGSDQRRYVGRIQQLQERVDNAAWQSMTPKQQQAEKDAWKNRADRRELVSPERFQSDRSLSDLYALYNGDYDAYVNASLGVSDSVKNLQAEWDAFLDSDEAKNPDAYAEWMERWQTEANRAGNELISYSYTQGNVNNRAVDPQKVDPVGNKLMTERDLAYAMVDEVKSRTEQAKAAQWEQKQHNEILAAGGEELLQLLQEEQKYLTVMAESRSNPSAYKETKLLPEVQKKIEAYGIKIPKSWEDYAKRLNNNETWEQRKQEARDATKDKPFWMSVASVPASLTSGAGMADVIVQKIERAITESDTPIDYKTSAALPGLFADTVRGTTAEMIEANTEGKPGSDTALGNLYSGAYQLGMSMLDSAAVIGLGAIGVPGSVLLLGGSAGNKAMHDAKERGATDSQAIFVGLTAAAAETVFEKLGIDNLTKNVKNSNLIKAALKQAFPEAAEEVLTSVSNMITDQLIMGGLSDYHSRVRNYMESGLSRGEAEQMVNREVAASLAMDAVGGAISGGIFGSAGAAINSAAQKSARTKQAGRAIKTNGDLLERLINAALERGKDTKSNQLAKKISDKLAKGKQPTDLEVGKLQRALARDVVQEAAQREAQPATEQAEPTVYPAQKLPDAGNVEAVTNVDAEPVVHPLQQLPYIDNNEVTDTVSEDGPVVHPPLKLAGPEQAGTYDDPAAASLPPEQRERYYAAGTNLERTGILYGATQEQIDQAARLAEFTGREVEFYNPPSIYDPVSKNRYIELGKTGDGKKIFLNPKADVLAQVFAHELTHTIESAGSYDALSKLVFARMKQLGYDVDAMRRERMEQYGEAGDALTRERADRELVAKFVEQHLLTDEASIYALVQQNPTLGQKIKNWLDRRLAKLGNKNAREREFLRRARDLYAKALQETKGLDQQTSRTQQTRNQLREDLAAGRITEAEFDEAMDALAEDEAMAGESVLEQHAYGRDRVDEQVGIREQLRENQDKLNAMEVVGRVTTQEYSGLSTKNVRDKLVVEMKKTGYKVDRKGFGEIQFEEDEINNSLNYKEKDPSAEDARRTGFLLLKNVLKRGIEIDGHDKHKGRNYDTVTIAAPVEINGERGNMAVVVRRTKGNRYKVHRILTPDGNTFYLPKKADAEMNTVGAVTNGSQSLGGSTPAINSASMNSVDESGIKVKEQKSIVQQKPDADQIASDLRQMLNRGASAAELRQYVDGLSNTAQKNTINRDVTPAERILRTAHRQGLSVQEYLQQNWELYDVDGELNTDARKALELEQGREQFSIQRTQNMTWEEQVRGALYGGNNIKRSDTLVVCDLDDTILSNLVDNKPLAVPLGILTKAQKEKDISHSIKPGKLTKLDTGIKEAPITIVNPERNAIVFVTNIKQGGLPIVAAFDINAVFDGDEVHKSTSIHLQVDVMRMLESLPETATVYVQKKDELTAVGATNNLRGLAADVKFIDGIVSENNNDVKEQFSIADAKAEQEAKAKEKMPDSIEQVEELYPKVKDAHRNVEKVTAKTLLTNEDTLIVGRLLRGEIQPEHVEELTDNAEEVLAVYEAKKAYEEVSRPIREWNRARRQKLRDEADQLLVTAITWKDKSGAAYSTETMERNIRDIVPDKELAELIIKTYFTPVHRAVAEANSLKNFYRDEVRKLDLSRKVDKKAGNKVSEAHAVQLLGEAMDNIRVLEQTKGRMQVRDGRTLRDWQAVVTDLWQENPGLDKAKIEKAVERFREIYDELFAQMNKARIRNGYEPVNYRSGYFPHFIADPDNGLLGQFGKALGITMDVRALPTSINGITHTFKPGIVYTAHAQERKGYETAYDAVEGFDKYIEGVADVICLTDAIQKLRALASQIRYMTTSDGIRKQIDDTRKREDLSEEDKEDKIESLHNKKAEYTLSNFVADLDEYTNNLANKKSTFDRKMEKLFGRNAYNVVKALENRVAANMIGLNIRSALTNLIPLTHAPILLDRGMLLQGMAETLKAYKQDDGFVDRSVFLTNRRGSDPLVRTWEQELSAKMSTPFEFFDTFTAESIVRARYLQNIKHGLSEAAAMEDADAFAASIMADRSKGATPTFFVEKNPLTKAITQFQLEVNNHLRFVFKDIPRYLADRGLKALTAALLKFFFGQWLLNETFEFFAGTRPALDPISILNETVGDFTGYALPNLWDMGRDLVTGNAEEITLKTEREDVGSAIGNLAGNVLEKLPFTGAINLLGIDDLLGIDFDQGRIPLESALPNVQNLGKTWKDNDWSGKKRWATRTKEVAKPIIYLASPFGGGQVKKTVQGITSMIAEGKYTMDEDGNAILQYPVHTDRGWLLPGTVIKTALFGPSAREAGQEWVESGFKNLSAKETAAYQVMLDIDGVDSRDAYDMLDANRGLKDVEKARGVVDLVKNKDDAMEVLSAYLKESTYYKIDIAASYGSQPEDWVEFKERCAEEFKGKAPSQEEAENILDKMKISKQSKAALWQICNRSWHPKNNPYNPLIGGKVQKDMEKYAEEKEEEEEEHEED